jgi:hypothetical protein
MTREEWNAYMRGGWAVLDDVLALLQTYEDRFVKKSELYQTIMDMRPRAPSAIDEQAFAHDEEER